MMLSQYPSALFPAARRSLLRPLRRGAAGFVLLAAVAFAGAACSSEEPLGLDGAGSGASGSRVPAYVSLRLTAPSDASPLKRGTPAGGEQGDGSETGQNNENAVRTVTAFFYPSTDFFADANDDPNMIMVQFGEDQITEISSSDPMAEKAYQTAAVDVDLEPGSYHVLAIVNGGEEVEGWTQGTLGLDRLRKRARTSAWTVTAGGNDAAPEYSDFVMSSAEEASITIDESNSSAEHPATAEISVERLAARVDYCPVNDFEVEDKTGTVTITGLALANNLTRGEYYFKRVTEGATVNGNIYLGEETADANGAGTNYVRDPWTDLKTEGNKDAANFPLDPEAQTTSKSYASALYASGHYFPTDCQNNAAFWSENAVQGTLLPPDENDDVYHIAAYTMENTLPKDAPLENYATAAVFKAIFQPAGLTADGGSYAYKEGDTFFEWNGALYLDLADIMDTYNEGGAFAASQTALTSATTWDAVRQILGTLTQADPTGYYEWLSGQITAAAEGSTPQADALTWTHYMLETFGYSRDAGAGAVIDQQGHDTQAELVAATGGIRTYRHSECYYTWFIKHAEDSNGEAQGVMEYGIVRNNIYKLKVNSVKGLGGMVPDEDNQLRVSVYVRNWRLLPEESLIM